MTKRILFTDSLMATRIPGSRRACTAAAIALLLGGLAAPGTSAAVSAPAAGVVGSASPKARRQTPAASAPTASVVPGPFAFSNAALAGQTLQRPAAPAPTAPAGQAAEPPAAQLPAAEPSPSDPAFYTEQVYPILHEHCARCHMGSAHKGGLNLDTRASMLKGGHHGPAVVPGDPTASWSWLLRLVRHEGPADDPMPMPPQDDKLSDADIATLTRWIQAGALMP